MNTFGHVLGQEQRIKGTDVALGPSIDVVRVPEWGRTFESYGEDPTSTAVWPWPRLKAFRAKA